MDPFAPLRPLASSPEGCWDRAAFVSAHAASSAKQAAMEAVLLTMRAAIEISMLGDLCVRIKRCSAIASEAACRAARETQARVDSVVSFIAIFAEKIDFVEDFRKKYRNNVSVMESLVVGKQKLREIMREKSSFPHRCTGGDPVFPCKRGADRKMILPSLGRARGSRDGCGGFKSRLHLSQYVVSIQCAVRNFLALKHLKVLEKAHIIQRAVRKIEQKRFGRLRTSRSSMSSVSCVITHQSELRKRHANMKLSLSAVATAAFIASLAARSARGVATECGIAIRNIRFKIERQQLVSRVARLGSLVAMCSSAHAFQVAHDAEKIVRRLGDSRSPSTSTVESMSSKRDNDESSDGVRLVEKNASRVAARYAMESAIWATRAEEISFALLVAITARRVVSCASVLQVIKWREIESSALEKKSQQRRDKVASSLNESLSKILERSLQISDSSRTSVISSVSRAVLRATKCAAAVAVAATEAAAAAKRFCDYVANEVVSDFSLISIRAQRLVGERGPSSFSDTDNLASVTTDLLGREGWTKQKYGGVVEDSVSKTIQRLHAAEGEAKYKIQSTIVDDSPESLEGAAEWRRKHDDKIVFRGSRAIYEHAKLHKAHPFNDILSSPSSSFSFSTNHRESKFAFEDVEPRERELPLLRHFSSAAVIGLPVDCSASTFVVGDVVRFLPCDESETVNGGDGCELLVVETFMRDQTDPSVVCENLITGIIESRKIDGRLRRTGRYLIGDALVTKSRSSRVAAALGTSFADTVQLVVAGAKDRLSVVACSDDGISEIVGGENVPSPRSPVVSLTDSGSTGEEFKRVHNLRGYGPGSIYSVSATSHGVGIGNKRSKEGSVALLQQISRFESFGSDAEEIDFGDDSTNLSSSKDEVTTEKDGEKTNETKKKMSSTYPRDDRAQSTDAHDTPRPEVFTYSQEEREEIHREITERLRFLRGAVEGSSEDEDFSEDDAWTESDYESDSA